MITNPTRYKSIFISDVHLGSKACESDKLCEFIKHNTCERLYLVGDIIDFWKIKRKVYWPQSHTNVIRRILTASKRNTEVKYILGNHDEDLREWIGRSELSLGNIELSNYVIHETVSGKRLFVTHGDIYDGVIRHGKWLSLLGDRAYETLLTVNTLTNKIRSMFGMDYWSFSSYVKVNTKQAVAFITKFEEHLINHARTSGYDGVICGHIHSPAMVEREVDKFVYMNTGDWCETISAIVEEHTGMFRLLVWDPEIKNLVESNRWDPTQ